MGFLDGLGDIFGDLGTAYVTGGMEGGDFSWGGFAGDVLGGFTSSFVQPVGRPVATLPAVQSYPVAAGTVPMAARAVAAGLPSWSARFPALWQALQRLRAQGTKASVEQLYSMLRKWGPASLSTIIGASAVADLVSYRMTHKRRRMNPANTRALRRSLRRLKSFDRLAGRVSMQLSRSCSRKRSTKKCA